MKADANTICNIRLTYWWWTPLTVLVAWLTVCNSGTASEPPKPIEVSVETTFITEPIAADGLPDYAGAVLERLDRKVKPEDNGAVYLWRAVGVDLLDFNDKVLLFTELGCDLPRGRDSFKPLPNLKSLGHGPLSDDRLGKIFGSRPWSEDVFPELSKWLVDNQTGLDLLRSVAKCDRYYNPSPSLLKKPPHPLLNTNIYGVLAMRRAIPPLLIEAASGNAETNAHANLQAVRRLAEFSLRDFTTFATQDAFKYLQAADRLELVLLQNTTDASAVARKVADCQARAVLHFDWETTFACRETLLMLDTMVREFSMRPIASKLRPEGEMRRRDDELHQQWLAGVFDGNQVLRVLLPYWNRLGEISSISDSVARRQAYEEFAKELDKVDPTVFKDESLRNGDAMPIALGEAIGAVFVTNLFPKAGVVFDAADTTVALQRLTLLAAALKLHQLRHGEYPESLDALAPHPLAEIPLDPFTNKPFVYERRDEGFAIWSLGRNGVDDGGSDQSGEFVDGEYAAIDWTGERPKPNGPDDVVVRLPVPVLELPGVLE